MPFNIDKLKGFYMIALKIGIVITLVWGILSLLNAMLSTGNWNPFVWSDFTMFIALIILEWFGWLMLNGKFQPPTDMQQRQRRPPTFGQPPRRPPQRQQQYPPRPPQQPLPIQPPQRQRPRAPIQLSMGVCSFCGNENHIEQMRRFRDDSGNVIYICGDCIDE